MYTQDFYIEGNIGNNAFSLSQRKNKKLYVPRLKKIQSFEEIQLLNPLLSHHSSVPLNKGEGAERKEDYSKITFEEYDFDGKMQTCFGLENLYELEYTKKKSPQNVDYILSSLNKGGVETQGNGGILNRKIPLYLVDNHNHVFYFWYLARQQGIISNGAKLYHIDEHADMRDPGKYLLKPESEDLQKVFEYTNFFLNVGNYIVPAQKEGLIGDVVQIRGESALKKYLENFSTISHNTSLNSLLQGEMKHNCSLFPLAGERIQDRGVVRGNSEMSFGSQKPAYPSIILNLDLDFFEPELDFIDYDLKKQVILDIAQKADLITVCTSPYFIDQQRALEVFRDVLVKRLFLE